jgi:hypothetical protein
MFHYHPEANRMYGLPKNINLDFFLDTTLIQICFGGGDLCLNFDNGAGVSPTIMVTSVVACSCSGNLMKKSGECGYGVIAPKLLLFLNQDVLEVVSTRDGILEFKFKSGDKIYIYDDSEQYESYVIRNGENTIVV